MKKLLLVIGICFISSIAFAQEITGAWLGKLNVGVELRVVFNISGSNDSLISTLDSPDQGAFGIPSSSTTYINGELNIAVPAIDGGFKGTYNTEKKQFEGLWLQGPNKIPLALVKVDSVPTVKRPQTPKLPLPYQSENVTFLNNEAPGVELAGTITIPEGKGPFNAVVLVSGSGPQNRNENLLNHEPFLVLSDYLTRNGIVVLRYDDRGVGESTGDFNTSTSMDFASDASAAVNYLVSRTDIPIRNIGIAGHSEGGLIAPITASENNQVDFIVLMAGPGIPGDSILLLQGDLIAKAAGISKESIIALHELRRDIMQVAKDAIDSDVMRNQMITLNKNFIANTPKHILNELEMTEDDVEEGLDIYTGEWMQFFLAYNPRPTLEHTTIPVLAINGTTDLQVPYKENLEAIEKALIKAGNKNYQVKALDNLNHLFQYSVTGSPMEYGTIEETFNKNAMSIISNWISAQK